MQNGGVSLYFIFFIAMTPTKVFLTILATVLVLGFFYFLTLFSPRGVYEERHEAEISLADALEMKTEAGKLYNEFLEKLKLGEPTKADMDKLEKSIGLLSSFIKQTETSDRATHAELTQMRTTLQNVQGRKDAEEIPMMLKEADEAFTKHNMLLALELYKKVYEAQERVNRLYPDSDYCSVSTLSKAEQMLRLVSAAPLASEIKEIQAQIKEHVALKHWDEAKKLYKKAISLQNKINKDYANTSYADFSKVRDFEIELDSLNAAPLQAEIEEALAAGKKCEEGKNYLAAAEQYRIAVDKQSELNTLFERSSYASGERLAKFRVLKDVAMSRPLFDEISQKYEKMREMLRNGESSDKILPLAQNILLKCESFKTEHPLSGLLDDETVLSLRYIGYLGKNLETIYRQCMENLLPINSSENVKMLKSEVSQSLYEFVMQENPSRNKNPENPVETVSYENALDFCRRLSWILGRKITLPSLEQLKSAVGSLAYVDLDAISWNAGNSGLRTHKVASKSPNVKGFYDLLGNVSEFTSADKNAKAFVFGGNAQTWTDALSEIPVREIQTSQNGDRTVGFRFVVSFSE